MKRAILGLYKIRGRIILTKDNGKSNVVEFKRNISESEKLGLANKIQVVTDLANDGIISQKERLRIVKILVEGC